MPYYKILFFYYGKLLIIISFRKMTIENNENVINESLNNIVVQFIHETLNDIFTILNISLYF